MASGIYRRKPNESRLDLPLINGSTIRVVSGFGIDNLRGETLHGVVIDEMRFQKKGIWSKIIYPMLTTTGGWAAFVSTPQGFDDFHDLYVNAVTDRTGDWFYMHSPSTCNPLFTEAALENARQNMSEPEFAQEIMAEFRNLTQGTAYFNFGEWNIIEGNRFARNGEPINPILPVHLYPDFNVLPMGWTMAQFRHGQGHHFFDEIFLQSRSNTEEASREFIDKLSGLPEIKADPKVIICGDASGKAEKTSSTGETDYTIIKDALRKAKISFDDRTPAANPRVKDRVNTLNARLKAADGSVQVTFDRTKCTWTIKDLYKVLWKQGATAILDQKTDPMLTHLSDTVGYGVHEFNPIPVIGDVGVTRVIRR
jgi:hypothetical protein